MEDGRDAERGTRAAVVGSILGIVPAVALGFLRFVLSEEPESFPQLAGHIAFTLVYVTPYALVLIAGVAPNPGVRGGLLLALGLLSFGASFSAFSLVTLAFLPATFVIWFAAVRSLTVARLLLSTALSAAVRRAVDRRYGRLRFLYAPAGAGPGTPVLDSDQRSGRTVPLGVLARSRDPRRTQRYCKRRWHSVLLYKRYHH